MSQSNGFLIDNSNTIHLLSANGNVLCGLELEAGAKLNVPDPNVREGHVVSCEECLRVSRKIATATFRGKAEIIDDVELEDFDG